MAQKTFVYPYFKSNVTKTKIEKKLFRVIVDKFILDIASITRRKFIKQYWG